MSTTAFQVGQNENAVSGPPQALTTGAGWAPLTGTGWIEVAGPDRVRWLNGMVTNSIKALAPGEGAYCFVLNAQGRIQGDGTVWCEPEQLMIETDSAQVEGMMALLDRFIIMDDVELRDRTGEWHGLQVAGPQAADLLVHTGVPVRVSRLLKRSAANWQGHELAVLSAYGPLVPRFEVWGRTEQAIATLGEALESAGAKACTAEAFESLRLREGTPRFGTDIHDRDLPQETAQTRALHFNKGCYLGQEIVERIRSRGRVHRTFTRFRLRGAAPAAGTELLAEDKAAGTLTSIAAHPEQDGSTLALGYVRQEALERALPLTYPGGTAEALPLQTASNSERDS